MLAPASQQLQSAFISRISISRQLPSMNSLLRLRLAQSAKKFAFEQQQETKPPYPTSMGFWVGPLNTLTPTSSTTGALSLGPMPVRLSLRSQTLVLNGSARQKLSQERPSSAQTVSLLRTLVKASSATAGSSALPQHSLKRATEWSQSSLTVTSTPTAFMA